MPGRLDEEVDDEDDNSNVEINFHPPTFNPKIALSQIHLKSGTWSLARDDPGHSHVVDRSDMQRGVDTLAIWSSQAQMFHHLFRFLNALILRTGRPTTDLISNKND